MQFYESFCSIVHNCIVTIVPQNTYSCALVCMIILDKSVLVTIKRNTQILCIGYNLLKWLSFPSINPKYDDILLGIYVPAFEHQNQNKNWYLKFIYSEKAAKFCEIFTLLLSYVVPVKSKVKIS